MLSWFSFANATKSTWIYRCGLLTPWQWYSSRWFPGQLGLGTPSCFWMWIAHTWIQNISFDVLLSIFSEVLNVPLSTLKWWRTHGSRKMIRVESCESWLYCRCAWNSHLAEKDPFAMEVEIISTLSECGYLSNTLQNSTLAVPTYMLLVLTVFPCSQLHLPQFLA